MSGMRNLSPATDSPLRFSKKSSRASILEIDSWMPSKIQAISPLVGRLMMLIQGSQSVPREEFGVELALREALNNAVVHGNQENPEKKVHIRCRCGPGNEVSIVVTDQGRGFDFGKILGEGLTSGAAAEHGRGIQLIKAFIDEVHFERGGSEVQMHKQARNGAH